MKQNQIQIIFDFSLEELLQELINQIIGNSAQKILFEVIKIYFVSKEKIKKGRRGLIPPLLKLLELFACTLMLRATFILIF